MVNSLHFQTKVSGKTDQGHSIRGKLLTQLVDEADFVATLFLSLTGRQPNTGEQKLFNAILVAALDHGIQPASGFVPRVIAASGNDMKTAMAGTLLSLGTYHGGAISDSMAVMETIAKQAKKTNIEQACAELVQAYRQENKRVMGYGHPHYKDADPRTQQLFAIARQQKLDVFFINLAETLEQTIEHELNRKLVLNIDGAIAALLLTLGIDPKAGNAIFAFARVGGSMAHILEELNEAKPVRRLEDEQVDYRP